MPALQDRVLEADMTHTFTRYGSGTNTNYGDGTETYDKDWDTYYGIKSTQGANGGTYVYAIAEHTWTSGALTIYKVRSKMYCYPQGVGSEPAEISNFYIWLKITGAWTQVAYFATGGAGSYGPQTVTLMETTATGWVGVTGVRVRSSGWGDAVSGGNICIARVYEDQCFYQIPRSYAGVT